MATSFYGNILEEELKNKVAADWFAAYDCTPIIGKIDFAVAVPTQGQQALRDRVPALGGSQARHLARLARIVHTAHPHHRKGTYIRGQIATCLPWRIRCREDCLRTIP